MSRHSSDDLVIGRPSLGAGIGPVRSPGTYEKPSKMTSLGGSMTTMGGAFGSLEVSQNTVASAAPYAQEVRDADSYADVIGAVAAAGVDMMASGQAPGGIGPVITQVSSAGGMFLIGSALANLISPRVEQYTKFTDPTALKLQRAAITAGASLLVYQLSGFPQYSLVAFAREAAASLAADYAFDMMMRRQ